MTQPERDSVDTIAACIERTAKDLRRAYRQGDPEEHCVLTIALQRYAEMLTAISKNVT